MELETVIRCLNDIKADMSQYKEMDTEELQATRRRLIQEASNKLPKYSADELRKLLCN
ncbi:hypothetical protein [Pelosinus baikalensis]|nr:hypothetical protein [Pelosinus baikalensis]